MQKGKVFAITANRSLIPADSGVLVIANAVDLVVTLPAADAGSKGVLVRALAGVASVTTGLSLSPRATDTIRGKGLTPEAGKDIINSAATDAVGDEIDLICDGNGSWFVTSARGTWNREA